MRERQGREVEERAGLPWPLLCGENATLPTVDGKAVHFKAIYIYIAANVTNMTNKKS